MPPRKRPATEVASDPCDDLHAKLALCGTTQGLVHSMAALNDGGFLKPELVEGLNATGTRRRVLRAKTKDCNAHTPYGAVVQRMRLPSRKLPMWEYAHPMALLYHLSRLSAYFGRLMSSLVQPGVPLKLIIYVDEICPGNPLRPDKARKLQSIYWAFADWPQWLLQRTVAWPTFGTLRSSIVDGIRGGMPHLMKLILRIFFAPSGHNFSTGVTIVNGREDILFTARFAGFLADEKAQNQIQDAKGSSGTKCCLACNNVFSRIESAAVTGNACTIACTDCSKFRRNTDAAVYAIYDHLQLQKQNVASGALTAVAYDIQSQSLGLNVNPDGIIADSYIRTFYKPITHCIHDWMHMLVNGGVANVQLARLLRELTLRGIKFSDAPNFHKAICSSQGTWQGAAILVRQSACRGKI